MVSYRVDKTFKNRGVIMSRIRLLPIMLLAGAMLVAVPMFDAYANPGSGETSRHAPVEIVVNTLPMGGAEYSICFGITDIINKNSKWLTATLGENPSGVATLMALAQNPTRSIATSWGTAADAAWKGKKPFRGQLESLRVMVRNFPNTGSWCTLDPKIKTLADCKGKRISVLTRGGGYPDQLAAVMEWHGIKRGEYKEAYMFFGKAAEALADGTVDAIYFGAGGVPISPAPELAELASTHKIYLLPVPADCVNYVVKKLGLPWRPGILPAGTVKGIDKDVPVYLSTSSIYVFRELDEEIVYEVVRLMCEHASEFKNYHGKIRDVTPEDFAAVFEGEEMMHPGAVRYFKEQGIKIGPQ
jgi:TRAP transporter TAXI family solute receptor